MSPTDCSVRQRNLMKIETPQEDGQHLSVPPLESMDELIAFNGRQRTVHDCDIQGESLLQLAAEARNQLVVAAEEFTRTYCDVVPALPSTGSLFTGFPSTSATESGRSTGAAGPLIMTGHQP